MQYQAKPEHHAAMARFHAQAVAFYRAEMERSRGNKRDFYLAKLCDALALLRREENALAKVEG